MGTVVTNLHSLTDRDLLHPDVVSVLEKLERRETGAYIDWDWWDHVLATSRIGTVYVPDANGENVGTYSGAFRWAWEQPGHVEAGASLVAKYASYHQWGLAVDLIFHAVGYGILEAVDPSGKPILLDFSTQGAWKRTGLPQFMKAEGFHWGGDWTTLFDPAHFELRRRVPKNTALHGQRWWLLDTELVRISYHQQVAEGLISESDDADPARERAEAEDSVVSGPRYWVWFVKTNWLPLVVVAAGLGLTWLIFGRKRKGGKK
jgi:hypothetical protein